MEPSYELLVHYRAGANPIAVAHALLDDWKGSGRSSLLHFPKSGEGIVPDVEFLKKQLTFQGDHQSVSLRLKTSRARKELDSADLYFMNPNWLSSNPLNYMVVTFTRDGIDTAQEGYTCRALGDLLNRLVLAAPVESGYVEAYEALHSPRMEQAVKLTKRKSTSSLMHWITFLPEANLYRVKNLPPEVSVLHEVETGGAILSTGSSPPLDIAVHVENIVSLSLAMGMLNESEAS